MTLRGNSLREGEEKMPFITVKAYPMDEETKRRTAEEILEVFRKT